MSDGAVNISSGEAARTASAFEPPSAPGSVRRVEPAVEPALRPAPSNWRGAASRRPWRELRGAAAGA